MDNKKITIYKFWIGDKQRKNELENQINQFNKESKYFYIHLGPTEKEHEYLYNGFEKYKYYFDTKQYAFLSDFYRFYVSSENENIIYMDATIKFNEQNLYNLVLECQNKTCFVFESYAIVWSGFFIANNKDFFKKCFEDIQKNSYLTSPLTMTKQLRKMKKIKSYKNYDENFCKCFDIAFLNYQNDNFDVIQINPAGSWRTKPSQLIWQNKIKNFKKTSFRDNFFLLLPTFLQKIVVKIIK